MVKGTDRALYLYAKLGTRTMPLLLREKMYSSFSRKLYGDRGANGSMLSLCFTLSAIVWGCERVRGGEGWTDLRTWSNQINLSSQHPILRQGNVDGYFHLRPISHETRDNFTIVPRAFVLYVPYNRHSRTVPNMASHPCLKGSEKSLFSTQLRHQHTELFLPYPTKFRVNIFLVG